AWRRFLLLCWRENAGLSERVAAACRMRIPPQPNGWGGEPCAAGGGVLARRQLPLHQLRRFPSPRASLAGRNYSSTSGSAGLSSSLSPTIASGVGAISSPPSSSISSSSLSSILAT